MDSITSLLDKPISFRSLQVIVDQGPKKFLQEKVTQLLHKNCYTHQSTFVMPNHVNATEYTHLTSQHTAVHRTCDFRE